MLALLPDRRPAVYEIRLGLPARLRGEIPPGLRERFPTLRIHRSRVETVLSRDVADLAELDVLLEQLQSLGVVLLEIRGSPAAGPSPSGPSLVRQVFVRQVFVRQVFVRQVFVRQVCVRQVFIRHVAGGHGG